MKYSQIVLFKKAGEFDDPLTYAVPEAMREKLRKGSGVVVPFHGSQVKGIAVELKNSLTEELPESKIRPLDNFFMEADLPEKEIDLASMISRYYHTSLTRVLKLMVPAKIWKMRKPPKTKKISSSEPADFSSFPLEPLPKTLTADQEKALQFVRAAEKPVLLHGITGSGKTEIYLRLVLESAKAKKQSILLVPEIALTPQMIDYFKRYFGDHIALFHSKMGDKERAEEWFKMKSGYAVLAVGSRSALFAPTNSLGLIIMDEEHEWTYKQESSPYYEAATVAAMRREIEGAKLVLGSATPRLESFYKAKTGEYAYFHLPERINRQSLPKVDIIDLRDEFKQKNFSIFSRRLQNKIRERLEKKEQVILFVNQRGLARAVVCRDCGYTEECPHCNITLKLHRGSGQRVADSGQQKADRRPQTADRSKLVCHYCGFEKEPNLLCPHCRSPYIKHVGIGTERVEEETHRLFPQARAVRADSDTTNAKTGFEPIYRAFKEGEYDILIGTQMVAKGLDFGRVTLIGIILADIGLHNPDFRSHERLFQLLTQVAGRSGRGENPGEVVLQTYQPEHFAILKAAEHDYKTFAEQELKFREKFGYPPFGEIIKCTVVGRDLNKLQKHVEAEGELLEDIVNTNGLALTLSTAPALIPKISDYYHFHLLIRGKDPQNLFNYWKPPKGWRVDVDPIHTV